MDEPWVIKSDAEWRSELTGPQYAVLRQSATEAPFTGVYTDEFADGVYHCRGCGAELFPSVTKFASHCGWPSFYAPIDERAVTLVDDRSMGMQRVEVRCRACGSHLGHVFNGEGYPTPTDQRYCINSTALDLTTSAD